MLPQALLGHSTGKGQQGLISKLRAENDKVRTEKKVRLTSAWSFPGGPSGKEPAGQCRRHKRYGFDPWIRKIPWRRKWQPTPVFLSGESHGQRSLAGYSPWGRTESDTTEVT